MHIGLVQVAVRPFIRKVDNVPIYMALTDKSLKKNKSSLLATINTNIHNRPIFLNCYPAFCIDFTCPTTQEALKLDVHFQGGELQLCIESISDLCLQTSMQNFSIPYL